MPKNRKSLSITAYYFPTEWGVKMQGSKIIAWALFRRSDGEINYRFYGDDADAYQAFEEGGFTKSCEVSSFEEAHNWIEENVMMNIGGEK